MVSTSTRVVVTGLGVVIPIGTSVEEFWEACRVGKTGIGSLSGFPLDDLKITIGAQVRDFDPKKRLHGSRRDEGGI